MAYLILNASPRAKGNSALLARLASKDVRATGAAARVIALRDMNVLQCTGCMRCVFSRERCPLDDDMYDILQAVADAEGLILIAPTYVTTIPAALKLVLDRYLLVEPYYDQCFGKGALTVPVASPIDWIDFQIPLLNMVALGLGFAILDTTVMYGAGPGEVLLGDEQVHSFRRGVERLLRGERRELSDTVSSRCPVCFNHLMERLEGTTFRCAVCHAPCELVHEGYRFAVEGMESHRWMPIPLHDHFDTWIRGTKGSYRSRLREIMKKKRELLGPARQGP
jgi:hypothetical protein